MPQIKVTVKEFDSIKEALRLAGQNAKETEDKYRAKATGERLQGREIESASYDQLTASWEERRKEYASLEQTLRSMQIGDTLKFG